MASVLRDWKFWLINVLGIVLLVLVIVNIRMASGNQQRNAEVVARQQFINESIQLSRFNTQFIQLLANLAAQSNDESLRRILSEHGITYTVNQPEPSAPAPAEKGKQ